MNILKSDISTFSSQHPPVAGLPPSFNQSASSSERVASESEEAKVLKRPSAKDTKVTKPTDKKKKKNDEDGTGTDADGSIRPSDDDPTDPDSDEGTGAAGEEPKKRPATKTTSGRTTKRPATKTPKTKGDGGKRKKVRVFHVVTSGFV